MYIFAQLYFIKMRRITTLILSLLVTIAALAQSPKAMLEQIRKYPNLAYPVASTYPGVPFEEIAATPEGFEPFYFTLVGRHGSRYEQKDRYFRKALNILHKADSLNILTDEGKKLHKKVLEIFNAQQGFDGELAPLGFEQWSAIGERAYGRFSKIFDSGSIEAKSSISLRCIFSMATFNDAIKGKNPNIKISQNARKSDLWIIRPLANDPNASQEAKSIVKEYRNSGEWTSARKEWERNYNASSFISKITTDRERLLKECGGKYDFRVARYSFITLIFGENFGHGDREMLTRLFTPEEMYGLYVYQTSSWVNNSIGRGNEIVEMHQSLMKPLVDDILNKAQAAIDGKNPDVANLRFTHDSYVGPLLSVMGYEGSVPQWNENIELAATSFNHGAVVPMAANLQIILYRNKQGKVFVRSLINERDAYLPIKSKTAPFYSWSDFCKYVNNNVKGLCQTQERVLKKHGK